MRRLQLQLVVTVTLLLNLTIKESVILKATVNSNSGKQSGVDLVTVSNVTVSVRFGLVLLARWQFAAPTAVRIVILSFCFQSANKNPSLDVELHNLASRGNPFHTTSNDIYSYMYI
jgi:hypothetical protein